MPFWGIAKTELPFRTAVFCNILEDELEPAVVTERNIQVSYRPFQIITLKLKRE